MVNTNSETPLSTSSGYSSESNPSEINLTDITTTTTTNNNASSSTTLSRNNSSDTMAKSSVDEEDELIAAQFSACIRELFLLKFVQMFVSYEKFVIVPSNLEPAQLETWWMNREYSGNFDSKMFLIEQPSPRLPFLSHFIATQMFVSFVDLKIISIIDPTSNKQMTSDMGGVRMFDERIRQFRQSGEPSLFEMTNPTITTTTPNTNTNSSTTTTFSRGSGGVHHDGGGGGSSTANKILFNVENIGIIIK